MTAKQKPPPGEEDEAQSKRFLDLASELEAAGDLSPTEAEGALDKLVKHGRVKQIGSIPNAE
jgi:hypothetical protein